MDEKKVPSPPSPFLEAAGGLREEGRGEGGGGASVVYSSLKGV